jgi:hypothetical protein
MQPNMFHPKQHSIARHSHSLISLFSFENENDALFRLHNTPQNDPDYAPVFGSLSPLRYAKSITSSGEISKNIFSSAQ